jgi:sugar phosphate isomerase/epimerase
MTALDPTLADRMGAQLYTIRDEMEKDFAGALERVARMGYREVELAGHFGHAPEEVRNLLDGLGLRAPSSHVGLDLLRGDLREELRVARVIGNEYLTVPVVMEAFRGGTTDLAFWLRTAQELNAIGTVAREEGIRLAYHNHWFEFDPLEDGRTGWEVLLAETDRASLCFELDLLWATFSGQDPVALFQRDPGRYPLWHVKDVRDMEGLRNARRLAAGGPALAWYMHDAMTRLAAVGTGELDFGRIFRHAGDAGLRHFFVENDGAASVGGTLEDLQTSYGNLRPLLAGD